MMQAVVQFPHPGREHTVSPREGGRFPWNSGDHRRKFLEADGTLLSIDGTTRQVPVRFWGEWEPPSDAVFLGPRDGDEPRWVHRPVLPEGHGPRQNTDPLVLGGFYYSNCKQHRRKNAHTPSAMQHLEQGSVILFGSSLGGTFVLDTVFVVAGRQEYSQDDYEQLGAPSIVRHAALAPLFSKDREQRYVLYTGATYEEPVEGMFSFVPAIAAEDGRFARPAIEAPGVINPRLMMGLRVNRMPGSAECRKVWDSVREQVFRADLELGVQLAAPVTPRTAQQPPQRRTGRSQESRSSPGQGEPC